jgi:hypothetical protein
VLTAHPAASVRRPRVDADRTTTVGLDREVLADPDPARETGGPAGGCAARAGTTAARAGG